MLAILAEGHPAASSLRGVRRPDPTEREAPSKLEPTEGARLGMSGHTPPARGATLLPPPSASVSFLRVTWCRVRAIGDLGWLASSKDIATLAHTLTGMPAGSPGTSTAWSCSPGQVMDLDRPGPPRGSGNRADRREGVGCALPRDREAVRDQPCLFRVRLRSEPAQYLDVRELDDDRPGKKAPVLRFGGSVTVN